MVCFSPLSYLWSSSDIGTAAGLEMIHEFRKGDFVDKDIRILALSVQSYLPEAALVSRDLALAFMRKRAANGNSSKGRFGSGNTRIVCPWHTVNRQNDKGDGVFDFYNEISDRKEDCDKDWEGTLECGCPEDASLFGFWWWKRQDTVAKLSESGLETLFFRQPDPVYSMNLWAEFQFFFSNGTIDDIYAGSVERVAMLDNILSERRREV